MPDHARRSSASLVRNHFIDGRCCDLRFINSRERAGTARMGCNLRTH